MAYTFFHCGVLIGESDLEDTSRNPRQRGGVFWPTPHGLDVFPRLTGILTAGHALKAYMDANGLNEDELDPKQVEELLDSTPAGRKVIDIGRMLSDVEVRSPDGRRLEFASIAFIDSMEMRQFAREVRPDSADDPPDLPADTPSDDPADAPRYMVSATFRHHTPQQARKARPARLRH
jgi:hypothetical protein